MTRSIIAMAAASVAVLLATPAFAQSATGTWLRDNGNSRVRIAPCGEALCGTIAWLKPGVETPSKVGQRVFFDMMSDGPGKWAGKAFNPEDGQTYVGKMSVSGSTLTTAGCRLGGLVCRSVNWSKVN